MVRNIVTLILAFSAFGFAQVQPPDASITFYSGGSSETTIARAEANTLNENILVVYNSVTDFSVYAQMVAPDGKTTKQIKLSPWNNSSNWDLCWHPQAKRYMFVYKDGTDIKVRILKATGVPVGGEKKVTNYSNGEIRIGPANKKRFIVYFQRNVDLVAISLKKNGNKFKSETVLVKKSGTPFSFPNSGYSISKAMMNNNNESVVMYLFKYDSFKSGSIRVIKTDHKLKIWETGEIAQVVAPINNKGGNFLVDYDKINEVYGVVFDDKYLIWKESFKTAAKLTQIQTVSTPTHLEWDPVSEQFGLLSSYFYGSSAPSSGAYWYMSWMDKAGGFIAKETMVLNYNGSAVNAGSVWLAFNHQGIYLLTYGRENASKGGFFGWIFN